MSLFLLFLSGGRIEYSECDQALEKEAEARAPEDKKEGPGERQHECRAGDAQVEESNEPFEREEWRGDGWTGSGER